MDIVERLREGRSNGTDLRWIVTEVHLEAAAEIEQLRAELAGRDAPLRPFRFGNYIKSEEDLTEYRRAIIEGVEAEIAAWLREDARRWKVEGFNNTASLAVHKAADAIASGEYRKGEG